jgi:formylglycine-generating enzyme required for sulfatase activity
VAGAGIGFAFIGQTVTAAGVAYTLIPIPGGTVDAGMIFGSSAVPITSAVSVPGFKIGETEITWELWSAVKLWGETNKGYVFGNPGRQGYDKTAHTESTNPPIGTNQQPVNLINWRDAVVWCNAYSEAAGKTPYYWLEGTGDFTDSTKVLRVSEDDGTAVWSGKAEKAALNPSADGFRLPTGTQWEYAGRGGVPSYGTPWTYTYAGSNTWADVAVWFDLMATPPGPTASVKSKAPNSAGLYDMSGNAWEWCYNELVAGGNGRPIMGGSADCGGSISLEMYCSAFPDLNVNNVYYAYGFRVICP